MPKKFQGENSKATAARAKKADAKVAEKEKQDRDKEDAYWADDDKQAQKKAQRKNEQEQKRQQQLEKKVENQRVYEEEMVRLAAAAKAKQQQPAPQKVTQAQIEQQKQAEEMRRKEEEKQRLLEQKKIVMVADEGDGDEGLPENVNRLRIEGDTAGTVDEAIKVLRGVGESSAAQDRHPEKRLKAAFTAFEERRIPQLKEEHPTLRLSQLKQLVKKEWQKSPENPLNQKIMEIVQ